MLLLIIQKDSSRTVIFNRGAAEPKVFVEMHWNGLLGWQHYNFHKSLNLIAIFVGKQ